MRAKSGLLKGLNPPMAVTAMTIIALFLLAGAFRPELAAESFTGLRDYIIAGFKWYYILVVALFFFWLLSDSRLLDYTSSNPREW